MRRVRKMRMRVIETAYRYCTWSIFLMEEPYIFSSLSKRVTERVFGGLRTFALAVALGFSSGNSAPDSVDSSSLSFLLSGSLDLPGVLVFLPVD